jgi:hypothetical protein
MIIASSESCINKYLDSMYEEKRIYQSLIQDITLTKATRFNHIGAINKELQTQLAFRQKKRLKYINRVAPERLKKAFLKTGKIESVTWEKSDEDIFLQTLSNRILNSKISVVQKQNQNHKDWPAFRKYFKTDILPSDRYKRIHETFFKNTKIIKEKIKSCFK